MLKVYIYQTKVVVLKWKSFAILVEQMDGMYKKICKALCFSYKNKQNTFWYKKKLSITKDYINKCLS